MNRLAKVGLLITLALVTSCSSKDPDRPTAADKTWSIWPGTITTAGSRQETAVSYVIKLQKRQEEGSFLFTPPGSEEQKIEMKDVEWDGSKLEYSWTNATGTELHCRLYKKSDTLLSGDCLDSAGDKAASMTMSPPAGRMDSI